MAPRRTRTYTSGWSRRPVALLPGRPPLPDDLTAIATDDLTNMIGEYGDAADDAMRVFTELDRRETVQAQAATVRAARIDALLAAGYDHADVVAEVDGGDPARMRLHAAADAAGRRPGEPVRAALRRSYDDLVRRMVAEAEAATCGHLLNAAGKAAGTDPAALFSGPLWRARRHASEDLMRWWEDHPRVTFDAFLQQIAGRAARRELVTV